MSPRLGLLAALLLAPVVAFGQLTITESNDQDVIINIDECTPGGVSDGLSFRWTISGFTQAGTYELFASDTSGCPVPTTNSGSVAVTRSQGTVAATGSTASFPATGSINVKTLLTNLNITCSSSSTNIFFCVDYTAAGTTQKGIVQANLQLDLAKPAKPTAVGADPADSALNVTWTEGTSSGADAGSPGSTNGYRVFVVPVDRSTAEKSQDFTGEGTLTGRVGGLENGKTYSVQVSALSPGNNLSDRSNTVQGVPAPVNDFWRGYRYAGGRETGGCATGAASLAALAALLPLALRRGRRRP